MWTVDRRNDRFYMAVPTVLSTLDDPRRQRALEQSGLLDTLPEPQYDRVIRIVSRLLGVPMALLSLVDIDRQFFKSACGLPMPWADQRQTPLSHSFCQHVVSTDKPFIVEDSRTHELVADNSAVTDLGVIAYLGVPVRDSDGITLGSLCAIMPAPRNWTQDEVDLMLDLAGIVENELDLRQSARRSDILAREYHHRVKNALAVASSLVSISGREASCVDEAVSKTQGRLMALASAHDSLISDSDNVSLAGLAERLLLPYCSPEADTEISGPTVLLRHSQVTPICLLLHELATNSAKYGALLKQGGLSISWTTTVQNDVVLAWEEHSTNISDGDTAGFGSKLIKTAVAQLSGTLETIWSEGTLRVVIEFPLQPRISPAIA